MTIKMEKNWDNKLVSEMYCDLCGKQIDRGECIDGIKQVNLTVIDDVTTDGEIYELYKGNQLKKTNHYCEECEFEIMEAVQSVYFKKLDKMAAEEASHEEQMGMLKRLKGLYPKRPAKVVAALEAKREAANKV